MFHLSLISCHDFTHASVWFSAEIHHVNEFKPLDIANVRIQIKSPIFMEMLD